MTETPNPPMTVAELRARRASRGTADPLNRLRHIMAEGVKRGQPTAETDRLFRDLRWL